jgi:hypothetical protein
MWQYGCYIGRAINTGRTKSIRFASSSAENPKPERSPIAARLRLRRAPIEKIRNGGHKLGRHERFCQKDTVGDAL